MKNAKVSYWIYTVITINGFMWNVNPMSPEILTRICGNITPPIALILVQCCLSDSDMCQNFRG